MRLLTAFAVLMALIAAPVMARAAEPFNPMTEVVSDANRVKPLQSPKYDRSEDILTRKILDNKNKVIGSVEDVVLNNNGGIALMDVKFDRMKLGPAVFVNYSAMDMEPSTNGYVTKYDANEIKDMYPTMLSDIQTASGDTTDVHSLRKLKGMEVWTLGGRKIGSVGDVLFGNDGARAELMYITLSVGNLRGHGIAIPFGQGDITDVGGKQRVVVADQLADAMLNYAKND